MQFQWPVLAHLIISTFDFVARFGGDRNNSPHRVIEPFVPESHRFSKCFCDVIENPNNAKNWYFRSPPAREKARPGGAGARIGRIFGPCARRAAFIFHAILRACALSAGRAWLLNFAVIWRAARGFYRALPEIHGAPR
ncbi:hypothetical protein [Burkholderia glumae]